jgi:hypothetical protein
VNERLPPPRVLFFVAGATLIFASIASGVFSVALLIVSTLSAGMGCVSALRHRRTAVRAISFVLGGGVWLLVGGTVYLLVQVIGDLPTA